MPLALDFDIADVSVNGQHTVAATVADPSDPIRRVSRHVTISDVNDLDSFVGEVEVGLGAEAAGIMRSKLDERLANTEKVIGGRVTVLPQIIVNDRQLPDVTAEMIAAMEKANDPPVVFTRGGAPARIKREDDGSIGISPMNESAMCGRIARTAEFIRLGKNDSQTATSPPMNAVRDVMALDLHEHGNFPILDAITKIPVFRPDGSILDRPGYDPSTRLYFAPSPALRMPPIPDRPTAQNVKEAIGLIEETIGEFPYEADADKANAVGTLITPVIRQAIDGKSPLALADAPQAGTGKSLIADVIGYIATGDCPAMMGAPTDDAEWRKQITATLLPGPTVVCIDNIDGVLSSPSLARVLTANIWSDRILGVSQQANLIQRATWIGTGNNIELGGDMPRRCYRFRLDAKTARPWRGRDFTHPDLLPWVAANRGRLVAAILTICRAWHVAGRPMPSDLAKIGSFEAWSRTVGGILRFAGVDGFLSNLDDMYEQADDGAGEWEAFLRIWHEKYQSEPVSVARIVDDLQRSDTQALRDSLPDNLGSLVVFQAGQITDRFTVKEVGKLKIRLGKQLRTKVGRRYGTDGLHLTRESDSHAKVSLWAVNFAGGAGGCGSVHTLMPGANQELHEYV